MLGQGYTSTILDDTYNVQPDSINLNDWKADTRPKDWRLKVIYMEYERQPHQHRLETFADARLATILIILSVHSNRWSYPRRPRHWRPSCSTTGLLNRCIRLDKQLAHHPSSPHFPAASDSASGFCGSKYPELSVAR